MTSLENPYPGLRPFRPDEDHLFFGRENQVNAMVDRLARNRFLAVVGSSGSGKSSLVNCGLRPALHRGLLAAAGTSWRVAQFRPGGGPIRALARALAAPGVLFDGFGTGRGLSLTDTIDATLRMSSLGLVDMFEQARLADRTNLLVVADQFEELFRYRSVGAESADQAMAFVNLLLAANAQPDVPIYVVLTMRSDFLGEAALIPKLPEAINDGQYLVPRMTREELRSAIIHPARVAGGDVTPVLCTRLVNDVGVEPEQLSILQHALNRTWAYCRRERPDAGAIDLADYESIGTMSQALDRHAERAFAEVPEGSPRRLCEQIFKALTDRGTDARGTRRPTAMRTLCQLTGGSLEDLAGVIDVFRKPSRSFLMPPATEPLEPGTVVDISHESLMRVWRRLIGWVEAEAEDAARFRRLAESATLHRDGRGEVLTGAELAWTSSWWQDTAPTEAWAKRYGSGFALAKSFLERSQDRRDRDALARRRAQQRRRLAIVAVTMVAVGGALAWQWERTRGIRATEKERAQLALKAAGGTAIAPSRVSLTDLFDVSRGVRVTAWSNQSPKHNSPMAMFGHRGDVSGVQGQPIDPPSAGMVGNGGAPSDALVTFFEDGKPQGFSHWVEFTVPQASRLRSLALFARHDPVTDGFRFRRSISAFRLYAEAPAVRTRVVEYTPYLPYGEGDQGVLLAVCLPVDVPLDRPTQFRAEFVQGVDVLGNFSAPRIVQLDGYADSRCGEPTDR